MNKNKIAIIGLTGQSIFMTVDEFHKDGETKHVNSLHIEPGGKGYNQAVACKKLGADVSYLTSIGKDEYGKVCKEYMEKLGIKCFFKEKDDSTALATILTNQHGDNQVSVYSGASKLLSLEDLESFKEEIDKCDILLVQNEINYEVLKEAIYYAKEKGLYVILNPAPALYDLKEVIDYVDLLIPNEIEAFSIYNKKADEININSKLELIITLGSNGCVYINKKEHKKFEALKTNAIDTTGAGDVFCASIAVCIKHKTIDEAINFATAASSLHIQKKYVIDAIPTIEAVNEVIKKCK